MKIAVFAHSCLLEVNRAIYRRCADEGHTVRIIVPSNHTVAPQPGDGVVDVVAFPRKGKGQRFNYYPQAPDLLHAFSPDLVILDLEPDSLLAVQVARWCARRQRKFVIQTCENLPIPETTRGKSPAIRLVHLLIRKAFLAYTVPRTFHTWPISSSGAQLLESFGFSRNRITRIPLGVNLEKFRPSATERASTREKWNVPPNVPVIAYIGRMVRQKGIHLLLDALSRLSDLPWKLAIDDFKSQQDGSYLAEIERLLALPVFQGRVLKIHADHQEIPAVMNGVDIVVVPSIRVDGFMEQYGRVIPEALACGTLVIASNTGAFPEVGGDAVRYFKQGDADDLTAKLRDALALTASERAADAVNRVSYARHRLSLEAQWEAIRPVLAPASCLEQAVES